MPVKNEVVYEIPDIQLVTWATEIKIIRTSKKISLNSKDTTYMRSNTFLPDLRPTFFNSIISPEVHEKTKQSRSEFEAIRW